MNRTRRTALLAGLLIVLPVATRAAPTALERARIERLIARVAARPELVFVRNGSDYSAADAARFLREKLKAQGQDVNTAEDFIERIASRSSTSGKPYMIRHPDGRAQPSAEFLRAQLAHIDTLR
jgi:hypothetical protein